MYPNAHDPTLLDELSRLGEALGPFVFGILSDTLSISEQLAFGYQLIAVAGRIRTRVEQRSADQRSQVSNGDAL